MKKDGKMRRGRRQNRHKERTEEEREREREREREQMPTPAASRLHLGFSISTGWQASLPLPFVILYTRHFLFDFHVHFYIIFIAFPKAQGHRQILDFTSGRIPGALGSAMGFREFGVGCRRCRRDLFSPVIAWSGQ